MKAYFGKLLLVFAVLAVLRGASEGSNWISKSRTVGSPQWRFDATSDPQIDLSGKYGASRPPRNGAVSPQHPNEDVKGLDSALNKAALILYVFSLLTASVPRKHSDHVVLYSFSLFLPLTCSDEDPEILHRILWSHPTSPSGPYDLCTHFHDLAATKKSLRTRIAQVDSFKDLRSHATEWPPSLALTLTLFVRSRIVPSKVNITRFSNIIQRAISESPLEEVEMLPTNFSWDFAPLQTSLKRLAIASSLLPRLHTMPFLQELVVTDVQSDTVQQIQRICPQISLLTLSGDYNTVSDIDTSSLVNLVSVVFDIVSPGQPEVITGPSLRRSLSSTAAGVLSLTIDALWTNESLESAICSAEDQRYSGLMMTCSPALQLWFRVPTCVSNWTALASLSIYQCQVPVFNALPSSLIQITLQGAYGSWTQREAGISTGTTSEFFDWSWLSSLPNLNALFFSGQAINGTMPNEFSHSKLTTWQFDLTTSDMNANRLVGTISPSWFLQFPAIRTFDVTLHGLTGTIPYYGLSKLETLSLGNNQFTHWPPLVINSTAGFGPPSGLYYLSLGFNNLVQIPSESNFQAMQLRSFSIQHNPSLYSTFPNIFATTTQRTSATLVATIAAYGCQFFGPLPEIPAYQVALYTAVTRFVTLSFETNSFAGTIPSSWSSVVYWLAIFDNPLTGTLATMDSDGLITSQALQSASLIRVSSDFLTGPFFNISAMPNLNDINLKLPNVDFCAASRAGFSFASTVINSCVLQGNATMCPEAYPANCQLSASPPAAPVMPPLSCPLPAPGASFICYGGVWLSTGSVTEETIVIPGASTTTIVGDLTSSSVVIASITSTVNVTGCITKSDGTTPSITITLSAADLELIIKSGGTLTAQLLQQASSCHAISASSVVVDTRSIKSCKKIKVDKIASSSGFAATFTVSNIGCNMWWIILVSVICGVILLAIIILVILAAVSPAFRTKIRPFSGKRSPEGAVA